jgi:hypothetical protein
MDYATQLAISSLEQAGYPVTPADRVPGLYDVDGLGRDLTLGQLWSLSQRYGRWNQHRPSSSPVSRP